METNKVMGQGEEGGRDFGRLSRMLRILGAGGILLAAAIFTLQSWLTDGALGREASFLLFTVAIASGGLLCGVGLKESKGARTFLGLSLALVPAHALALGGLLYAATAGVQSWMPSMLRWEALGVGEVALALLIAIPILTAITAFAFSVLTPRISGVLAGSFLAGNAVLLLPVRGAGVVALLGVLLGAYLLRQELRSVGRPELQTFEGYVARLLQFVPLGALFLRGGMHESAACLAAAATALVAAGLHLFPRIVPVHRSSVAGFQLATGVAAFLSWGFVLACDLPQLLLVGGVTIGVQMLPFALILFVLSVSTVGSGRGYRNTAVAVALFGALGELFTAMGFGSALIAIAVGIGALTYGTLAVERGYVVAGLGAVLAGGVFYGMRAIAFIQVAPWLGLAVLGAGAVLAGSLLERNQVQIRGLVELGRRALAEAEAEREAEDGLLSQA